MSIVITGSSANITAPLTATVTALANNGSGEIRATTSTPHLFGNNDTILLTTSTYVLQYPIAVIDATHFDLVGSTYTATATGTAEDLSITPQIQFPTDGDTFSAQLSGLLSSSQALCDRTQYLMAKAVPQFSYFVAAESFASRDNDAFANYANVSLGSNGVWTSLTSSPTITINNVMAGDHVVIRWGVNAAASGSTPTLLGLGWSSYAPGGSPSFSKLGGTGRILPGAGTYEAVQLSGVVSLTGSSFGGTSQGGSVGFELMAMTQAEPATVAVYGDYFADWAVLRAVTT